jgi:dethiobiotin synthetase
MNLFITGIGTNVGKTIVSTILTESLQADYWKPIQSGTIESMDSETVRSNISNDKTVIHPEAYLLKEPLSPHFAAKLDGITIEIEKINLPITTNHLIIEGAGGILVPINDRQYVIDIAKKFDCEIILVISNYLGCINHSLLSIEYLKVHNLKLHSLVFNGEFEYEVKNAILQYSPQSKVVDIPTLDNVCKASVIEAAKLINW